MLHRKAVQLYSISGTYRAVSHYLYVYMCNIQTINDFGRNSCIYKMKHISGVTFIYRSNNITQKSNFLYTMGREPQG